MDNVYVHFGSEHFNKERFVSVENRIAFTKPYGGLWGSPINTECNWENWCKSNDFELKRLEKCFYFKLKSKAKRLYINNVDQLKELPKVKQPEIFSINLWDTLDFEKLSEEYDALEITLTYEDKTKIEDLWSGGLYQRLYGWDVDSILVMNPDIVEEIENLAENA